MKSKPLATLRTGNATPRYAAVGRELLRFSAGAVTCVGGASLLGCTGAASIGVGAALLLAWPLARVAFAGLAPPCRSPEARVCERGHIQNNCCDRSPTAFGCNEGDVIEAFVDCGHGLCAIGADLGRCAAPRGYFLPEVDSPDACTEKYGRWAQACLQHAVEMVCVPPMPTNFSGPGFIPRYKLCGPKRCTTHILIEDCYPTADDATSLWPATADNGPCIGVGLGLGSWQKVCLQREVAMRCVPLRPVGKALPLAAYVQCPDGSCAVGQDTTHCPK